MHQIAIKRAQTDAGVRHFQPYMKRIAFKSPRFGSGSKEPAACRTQSRAIFIGTPSEDSVSTDTSLTPNPHLCGNSFLKELESLGSGIPDRNPVKATRSRSGSPASELKGLPFQRRARSNSPHNSPILFGQGLILFPRNSPIRATKQVIGKKTAAAELKRVSLYRYESTLEIDSSSSSSSDDC